MDKVLELEAKVADLEKRIRFLYRMIEKQQELNSRFIENHGILQDSVIQYANATNQNTHVLNMLCEIMKEKES